MRAGRLVADTRGVVLVEHLISYLPVMFFFFATWQLIELCAAHLIVRRAASAAARAAVVVLPDDPAYYDGVPKDALDGKRRDDVKMAAALVLGSNPHFGTFGVGVTTAGGSAPLEAAVVVDFRCFAGWASLVCGLNGVRQLTARSSYVYQGASYSYEQ